MTAVAIIEDHLVCPVRFPQFFQFPSAPCLTLRNAQRGIAAAIASATAMQPAAGPRFRMESTEHHLHPACWPGVMNVPFLVRRLLHQNGVLSRTVYDNVPCMTV